MRFTKAKPDIMEFKYSMNQEVECGDPGKLVLLWINGRPIQSSKKDGLMKLMAFVPPCHHAVYSNIRVVNTHSPESTDGFTGPPDFQLIDK